MGDVHVYWVQYVLGVLLAGGVVWWFIAPVIVRAGDPRLASRNKDHYQRQVSFYRIWGTVAAAIGIAVALFLR